MSRGLGKLQRTVLLVLAGSTVGGMVMPLNADDIARQIWDSPTRAQTGAVRRALTGLEDRELARCQRGHGRSLLWARSETARARTRL